MDRADLAMLVAVAREGTLTAAAERLHTAQPALSQRLRRLEQTLGLRLFDRGRHGATPTPGGRVVIDAATHALRAVTAVERTAQRAAAGETATLHIGVTPTLGADVLPPALGAFRAAHPEVHLALRSSGNSADLRAGVRAGTLDLAVAVVPATLEPGLRIARSGRQVFVAVVPADTGAARAGSLSHADLARQPIVALERGEGLRQVLENLFARLGDEPEIAIETTEREMLIPFVAAGLGVTVVPRHFADQRVGTGTVAVALDPPVEREVAVLVAADRDEPLVERFADAIEFD